MKSASERYAALVRLVESRTVTRAMPPLLLPADAQEPSPEPAPKSPAKPTEKPTGKKSAP